LRIFRRSNSRGENNSESAISRDPGNLPWEDFQRILSAGFHIFYFEMLFDRHVALLAFIFSILSTIPDRKTEISNYLAVSETPALSL
jgi:hypothetical protein